MNGNGLPDLVEMNGVVARYWENLGEGRFAPPRPLTSTPQNLSLADPGVRFLDATGNGRPDLLIRSDVQGGYFPMRFQGGWDQSLFQAYEVMPAVDLNDPNVTFIDLDGDGVTDILRTGVTFECYFNDKDPNQAWKRSRAQNRRQARAFPDISLADPRVRTADMTGDGLQDIVYIHNGRVDYWPNKGYGNFGARVTMKKAPLLPMDYRPEHLLMGDIDGSGCADLLYVEQNKVTLWINQQGNGFSAPIVIRGTPGIIDSDAVRLIDLYGTGSSGLLWTRDLSLPGRPHYFFLDFTGGQKPYLLTEMDNQMGALTRVGYTPSTAHYLRDNKRKKTRWKTPLPFPVQTVTRVEVIDKVSKGKLTTEYEYRSGYWDGFEREFRGFGEVIQRDTETFEDYNQPGFFPDDPFTTVPKAEFSPPLETRHWFNLGPVYDPRGGWTRWTLPDYQEQYWQEDKSLLTSWNALPNALRGLTIAERRDALRTLRGTTMRTELYALDGTDRETRPYVVSESLQSLRKEGAGRCGNEEKSIFFPFSVASRTTNWDRGNDPATTFEFVWDYDEFGQPEKTLSVACPRAWSGLSQSARTIPFCPSPERLPTFTPPTPTRGWWITSLPLLC